MTRIVAVLTLVGALASTACDSIGQAMTAHTDVVARAGGHELKVDKAAQLMTVNRQIPNQPDVVMAVANLWVDYMLLATAAARDSTMRVVDLDELIGPILDQEAVNQLRESVIKVDTMPTDDELRKLYDASGMGVQLKARHVLLTLAPDAPPAQRDSVTKLAQQIRQQAAAGADFAELAKKYSQEPGAAERGGDLGTFGRGAMVAPFEEAAFKLQPGQISDVVETPFGLHVIKVEARTSTPFDSIKGPFREQTVNTRRGEAEETYMKSLTEPIKVEDGAVELMKEIATRPENDLKGRAGSRDLVSYKGGSLSARDFLQWARRVPAQNRASLAQRSDDELKNLLTEMAKQKGLIDEAKRKKLSMPAARADSLKNEIYKQLVFAVQSTGLMNIQPQSGENKEQAIERRVNTLLEATIKGEQNVIPLGPLSYGLREQFGGEVFERAVPLVVTKVDQIRPPQPPAGPGDVPPQLPPTTTTGN
jgi:peptidyl-prolyl cis-trans isomerase C